MGTKKAPPLFISDIDRFEGHSEESESASGAACGGTAGGEALDAGQADEGDVAGVVTANCFRIDRETIYFRNDGQRCTCFLCEYILPLLENVSKFQTEQFRTEGHII